MSSIKLKEFATQLNNREYRYSQFTEEEIQTAKENGIVIVYGASDDLMEFDGAIYDEIGCFDGGKAYISKDGVVQEIPDSDTMEIEAVWCDKETLDENGNIIIWTYKTDIPHEMFMIYDEGKPYCRGIVFRLKDL